jgi:hypothetical protein
LRFATEPTGTGHEGGVGALEMLDDWQAIHDNQAWHQLGMIHRRAERDQRAAIVPDHGEAIVAEVRHQAHHITGHRSLARLGMARSVRGKRWPAVPTQVGSHDEVLLSQPRGDRMPRRMSTRMTVQQHYWRAGTPIPDPCGHLTDINVVELEAVEHRTDATSS